jgi:hypothetical protein
MVVIPHKCPRQDSPTVEIAHSLDGRDELVGLVRIVKNEFTASNTAVDVVAGSGDE